MTSYGREEGGGGPAVVRLPAAPLLCLPPLVTISRFPLTSFYLGPTRRPSPCSTSSFAVSHSHSGPTANHPRAFYKISGHSHSQRPTQGPSLELIGAQPYSSRGRQIRRHEGSLRRLRSSKGTGGAGSIQVASRLSITVAFAFCARASHA